MACWSLIDFGIDVIPTWRGNGKQVPSVQTMIEEIVSMQTQWKELCSAHNSDNKWKSHLKHVREQFVIDFIHKTSQAEGVGVQGREKLVGFLSNEQKSRKSNSAQESKIHSKEQLETLNLLNAWQYLWDIVTKCRQEDPFSLGLIDVDECVKGLNRIVLKGISLNGRTKGGQFSTEHRVTTYKGEVHEYPFFESEEAAYDAVLLITDRYNELVSQIRNLSDSVEKLTLLYKCAAWLLFELVSLHPFSDGNGRVCRLLCSYCLSVVTPFPTPVHSVFSCQVQEDYINAIVKARSSEKRQPVDLTCLLVESSWTAWKLFIAELNKTTSQPTEKLVSSCLDQERDSLFRRRSLPVAICVRT
ncbi:hypothetical protein BaRGS_00038459 [Batillaria attramentaria]|uniref:Fido domain-containing protein n=1 Tax=Batillaria attramentaria TaxID=370345 RepID=A0ABD0J639_9CAEN